MVAKMSHKRSLHMLQTNCRVATYELKKGPYTKNLDAIQTSKADYTKIP